MSRGYQLEDAPYIDYQLYELPGVPGTFRGPAVTSTDYIACVGAAQTFGRFALNPYPALLSSTLGIDALNLGRGGAGPTFPVSSPELLAYINRARLVVLQIFSGRSHSNSLFKTSNHGPNGTNLSNGKQCTAEEFYTWLLQQDLGLLRQIVAETRENYLASMEAVLLAIKPPTILFWYSVRPPAYQEKYQLPIHELLGEFPQFVNQAIVVQLQKQLRSCDRFVECVSRRGLPQSWPGPETKSLYPVRSPLPPSIKPVRTANLYYPSPEMHEEAAAALHPVCVELLQLPVSLLI